jgi:dephospho-CoA kinase
VKKAVKNSLLCILVKSSMSHISKRIIGLTGGIGTGKTTVSKYLASHHHIPVLDADIYARDAVQLGSPVLGKIRERYGKNILLPDGTLNRKRLGEMVFSHHDERQWLEQQIHPYVRSRFQSELYTLADPTVVLVIPLLFEAGMNDLVTQIWVVNCSPEQQKRRISDRDQLTPEQALARINSQLPLEEKVAKADVILNNTFTPEFLLRQVDLALLS